MAITLLHTYYPYCINHLHLGLSSLKDLSEIMSSRVRIGPLSFLTFTYPAAIRPLATGINNSSFVRDVFSCSFKVLLAETSWLLVILLILIALKATEITSSADFVFCIVAFDVSPLGQKEICYN